MKILLPFFDDSTLIFASRMRQVLSDRGHSVEVVELGDAGLQQRQLDELVPLGDYVRWAEPVHESLVSSYDAVITCKTAPAIGRLLASGRYRKKRNRPAFVAFQPGLEFSPERGRQNRRWFDVVFLYSVTHRDAFRAVMPPASWQHVSYGHPYFILPSPRKSDGRNIYFFTQAISPSTLASRRFVVDVLATLARRHPNRKVLLKLRHLPSENTTHVHREQFTYSEILDRCFPDAPANLAVTVCSMEDALADAAIAITCTSTAAMDAVSAGVPTMIYLDYIENYLDPLALPMRQEFSDSGLICDLHRVMNLEANAPDPIWLQQHFRGDDLYSELEISIAAFKARSKIEDIEC